ncbi:DNA cytosine methyltransferase [uncultured Ornithinimicrobium sp.]|uniref:DNA cytosine methyltransferase n=1 Tax=uncultured Ornithinimicrobium sp. TaxID=259307 RepID=UPI002596051A|nr:DNA cytosine methyltransferase [uncultured Ornithinimicrobium sp.]
MSLYAGSGGMDLGFVRAGATPVWANELNVDAARAYMGQASLGRGHMHVGDILEQSWPSPHAAELVVGGPPCQGFSVAGRMDPEDPRSQHVVTFLDMVERVQPQAFVMENVKALAANRRWEGVRTALSERAKQLGYVTQMWVLNAADYSVAQARERMFLVGTRKDLDPPSVPRKHDKRLTVRAALQHLPPHGNEGNAGICMAKITFAKNPVLRPSPYAGMLFNGQGRPLRLDGASNTLPASMGGNRTPIIDEVALRTGSRNWIEGYHQHLMAGGAPYAGATPSQLRRITVQEAAALQTFPPGTVFSGTQGAQYAQIGNAVPPNLAFAVASSVLESFGVTSSRGDVA